MTRPCLDALEILARDPHDLELDDHDLRGIERSLERARQRTAKQAPPRERRPDPIPAMRLPSR